MTATQPAFEVFRDAYGIPHLRAGNVTDLAFAQGHTAARDRCWQLDIERRRGEGRVAALLGPGAVDWDTFARRARIDETARRAYDGLGAETRAFVTAYAEGVNAGLDTSVEHRALEATPGVWNPWTPLTVFSVQQILFGSFPMKLWRQHVSATLGAQALADLRPGTLEAAGSNAFAVAGQRTTAGAPLIAGDPHRLFEAPNVYAQVRLACDEFDVVGFTFPGVPGIQHFGHTGSVAWAITNAMADYQDLFWEGADAGVTREEVIDVRGEAPVTIACRVTDRGPVVIEGASPMALRTPTWVLGELGFDSLLPLLRARTVADVDAALDRWIEPVNNVVIADTEGSVVHRVAGKVPVRPRTNRTLPASPDEVWTGWVDRLPRSADRTAGSPTGVFVTANDRIDDAYDVLGDDFAPPYRADRIRSLLGDRTDLSVDDLAAILSDTWSARAGADLRDDQGRWHAGRDAAVSRLEERFAAVGSGSPFGSTFDAWFHLPSRIAAALDPASVTPAAEGTAPRVFHPLHELERFGVHSGLVDELRGSVAREVYGDGDCICAMHAVPDANDCVRGPVARYVWDLADRENSRWVVPLGATGEGTHRHDQLDLWASGHLVTVVTDWDRLRLEVSTEAQGE